MVKRFIIFVGILVFGLVFTAYTSGYIDVAKQELKDPVLSFT